MTSTIRNQDYAATLLRLSLGILFLAHAGLKIFTYTMAGTVAYFESIGLNAAAAWLTVGGELLGGIALLAGVMTRWASLGLAVIAFGAIYPHAGNGWVFSAPGGGWEFPLFLGITALVQALLGPGTFALKLNAARA